MQTRPGTVQAHVATTIFRLIQIAWFPIALVGYVLFVIKLILFSRKSGVSSTTLASLYTRWMQHQLGQEIRCFELDTPKTQATKRQMLKKAHLDTTRNTFVPADFMTEDWLEKLVHAGFDPHKPTFFLWEAVTMYLDREAVESTLHKIAGTASGSVVAFDYFHADLIHVRSPFWRYARAVTNAIGEPFRFGIESTKPSSKHVAAFLAACGLSMEEQCNFGRETDRKPAVAGFTTAIVPRR